jgi:hypothetical protein
MALDFTVKDVMHHITVKFVQAFLPEAKKKYHLKAVFQPELDIHGIASKAAVYNIQTSPKVIEEGLNAGMELMHYLAGDGFKLKTPIFNFRIRLPGDYDGTETRLDDGCFPEAGLTVNIGFRNYLKECVTLDFDGIDSSDGFIGALIDEATNTTDQVVTRDNLLTVLGYELKVEGNEAHSTEVGVYFEAADGTRTKAKAIAVNEPRAVKVIAPPALTTGAAYHIVIVTQSSAKNGSTVLKTVREVKSEYLLIAQD